MRCLQACELDGDAPQLKNGPMTRSHAGWLLSLVAVSACGGAPRDASDAPTTGGDPVEASPAGPQAAEDKKDDPGGLEAERTRAVEIPPPIGLPPPWLSMPQPAYQSGAVFKFTPAACEERFYVNASGLAGGDAAFIRQLFDKFARLEGDRREYDTVMRVSKEFGVEPFATLREIAACEGKGPDIVVVGIATDKPTEMTVVFQKVIASLGKAPGRVERDGDTSLFANPNGDEAVAQFGPNVLVFGPKDAVLAAGRARSGGGGFADAAKHLVRVKAKEMDLTVTEKGPNIEASALIKVREGGAKRANDLATEIKADIQKASERLANTPLKVLGERLRATKVAPRGNGVMVSGTLSRADLTSILKSAASADLEQVMRSLKK